jgi:predicted acetyltransferase
VTIRIRRPREDELDGFVRALGHAFSDEVTEAELEHGKHVWERARDLAAYEDGRIVGTTASYGFRLSVPGGEASCAGVTAVAVVPTHRRRGILTRLMRKQLADVHARDEPLAALWASEGGIYGRFGYGLATRNARIDAERDRVAIPPTGTACSIRLVGADEAAGAFARIYDRAGSLYAGFPSRSRAWWKHHVLVDHAESRRGAGPLHLALLELGGRPQGYALYRMTHGWAEGFPAGTLRVEEEVSLTPAATRELWRFLFGVDLVARVQSRAMPPDHPLFLLAAEPSRLRFRVGDGIFVRLVDVPVALRARTYGEGSVTFEVTDPVCSWNEGRWTLEAGPGGAAVRASRRAADITLDAGALASAYLGGFSFGELVRAGRVEESRRGAAVRADALFRTERAPWCPGFF